LASVTGGTVHGSGDPTYIQNNYVDIVTPPEFPYVDTSVFAPYATNTYVSGMTTLQNVRIPAGLGTAASPLSFAGGTTVQGILYIQSPNVIRFSGSATIEGMIIFENKGTSTDNQLIFSGNAQMNPLPAGAMFDAIRSIKGVAILAPTASVTTMCSTDSYFKGNVIVGNFNELGSATIKMDAGSIVAMDSGTSATFNGNTTRFMSTGVNNPPSIGVKYTAKFIPINGTYGETN
jgi:phage gp45-like